MNSATFRTGPHQRLWISRLFVLAIMFAYCLPAPLATLWPDTVRDLAASLSLVRDGHVPLVGPPVDFGPHLGPAWIWLQAVPLCFFASISAVALYVAIVASLKYILLFELGYRISGCRLGLCFALAATFPSAPVFHWIVFFHPNWVETATIASLLMFVIALQRGSWKLLYGGVGLLGLAIQFHATAAFYFPLAIGAAYRLGARGPRLAGHLAAMTMLIALWFVPTLFAPATERGSIEAAAHRIAASLQNFSLADLLTVLKTAYVDLPIAVGETYAAQTGLPLFVWEIGLASVGVALGCGLLGTLLGGRAGEHRPLFALLALLLLAWAIAVAIRSFTSFYLVYFLFPLSAICMGLLLESALSSSFVVVRSVTLCAAAFLAVAFLLSAEGARTVGSSGFIQSRILAMGDLMHPRDDVVRGTFATAAFRDSFAKMACAQGDGAITLHGDLAHAMSLSLGLDFRIHCPNSLERFRVLGRNPGIHLTAIPKPALEMLRPGAVTAGLGPQVMAVVRPEHPMAGRSIEREWYHFERLHDRTRSTHVTLRFSTEPGQLVAIHRLKPYDSEWKLIRIEHDANAATAAFSTFNSSIYQAPGAAEWAMEFQTDAPQWVDVYVF